MLYAVAIAAAAISYRRSPPSSRQHYFAPSLRPLRMTLHFGRLFDFRHCISLLRLLSLRLRILIRHSGRRHADYTPLIRHYYHAVSAARKHASGFADFRRAAPRARHSRYAPHIRRCAPQARYFSQISHIVFADAAPRLPDASLTI